MADAGFCPRCGSARVPGQGFCTKCGMRFDAGAASPPSSGAGVPPPPPPPPSQYPSYEQPTASYQQPTYQAPPPSYQQPPPYQQAPSYQASAPASRGTVSMGGVNVRLLPLVGAALVAIGALLPWFAGEGVESSNALDIPFKFLFDPKGTAEQGGFTIGIVLLILGIGGAILTFMPGTATIRRIAGSIAALIAVVLVIQVVRLFGELDVSPVDVLTDLLSFGVYVTLVGGVLLSATK